MSSNDFLEFDDDTQMQGGSSGRNPFVILAGALVTILILASICTVYLLSQRNQGNGEEVAAIETQNAIIAVTNEAVTQTIMAMETESSQVPTETPTPTSVVATEVPTETPTVPVTDTPVVSNEEEEEGEVGEGENEGESGEGESEAGDGTVDAGGSGTITNTETITQGNTTTTDGSTPAPAFEATGKDSTLPQTGLDTWTAVLLAIFFIGILVVARRLRTI